MIHYIDHVKYEIGKHGNDCLNAVKDIKPSIGFPENIFIILRVHFYWCSRTGTSYAGVGRRRMRSVSCAPVECVDGFVWIVIGGFWCTSAGFYASTGIKQCRRVPSREGKWTISFGFSSKTKNRTSFTFDCLVTAQASQIKMACAALASSISPYFFQRSAAFNYTYLWQRSNGIRIAIGTWDRLSFIIIVSLLTMPLARVRHRF